MSNVKVITVPETSPDVARTDTKVIIDNNHREGVLYEFLAKLRNTRIIAVTVDRDPYSVNYTIFYED